MHTHLSRCLGALALLAVLVVSASRATAETRNADSLALGWMTEHADLVALVEAGDPGEHRVVETLRGPDEVRSVKIELRSGLPAVRARALVFLRRTDDAWTPVTTQHAILRAPPVVDPSAERPPFPQLDYVRAYAATLAPPAKGVLARVERPAELAEMLTRALTSPHGGIPLSAGRDLCRHANVLAAVTDAQRRRIETALTTERKPDLDLAAIIRVAGYAGDAGTDVRLVERLLATDVRNLRRFVVRALTRRASPELAGRLVTTLERATGPGRAAVAMALGGQDTPAVERSLVGLLRDDAATVRVEAAHSLGKIARARRKVARDARARGEEATATTPDALEALRVAVAEAKTPNVRRAGVWALAQLDTREAWALLERLQAESPDAEVRRIAAIYRARPSASLVLGAE